MLDGTLEEEAAIGLFRIFISVLSEKEIKGNLTFIQFPTERAYPLL